MNRRARSREIFGMALLDVDYKGYQAFIDEQAKVMLEAAREAVELRDGDRSRYLGKGVTKAVANVNGEIRDAMLGRDAADQSALERGSLYVDPGSGSRRYMVPVLLGGMADGEKLKAVIVGGSSVPVLPADEIMDVPLDYEALAGAGTILGSGGMIVIPESSDMVELIQVLMHFYFDESCGQCTPCREGTGWLHKVVKKLRRGEGVEGDIDLL